MLRSLLFWICFPLVIPQALWVRRTAPRFSAATGSRSGSAGSGYPLTVLAIGDSIVAGVGATTLERALVGCASRALAAECNAQVNWHAVGRIGANAGDVLQTLVERLPSHTANAFIVSVGVNDVTSLQTRSRFRNNLRGLIAALSSHSPGAVLAFAGVPPLGGFPLLPQPLRAVLGFRATMLDRVMRSVTRDYAGAVYVPVEFETDPAKFSADGYHPSEASYREFGQAIAAAVAPELELRWRSSQTESGASQEAAGR